MAEYLQQEKMMDMVRQPIPGKRVDLIRLQVVRESAGLYGISRFTEPQEAADMMRPLISASDREVFLVMSVNTRMAPMAVEIVAVGTLNTCLVEMREVFKHAILNNAAGIVCFHNHPSGNSEPSREDILMTQKLKAAGELLGIPLVDHTIVTEEQYYSFKEQGNIFQEKKKGEIRLHDDCV
ncbi:JAB domain-containing protein [Enterocloster clostridioformis]|uniref:JAB domain-containing protein n=1 Tax=Enterocloster clostridioformis TaxID=1531 RepID=UPI002674CCEB|nr:JAB domain-containing protein [Enterocloster clostridioformis]